MAQAAALFILDDEDARIHELAEMLTKAGSLGIKSFTCVPESKTVTAVRESGTAFAVDYPTFERWFVEPHDRPKLFAFGCAPFSQATEAEREEALALMRRINARITPEDTVDRFFFDRLSDEVIQVDKDGSRHPVGVRAFVNLLTSRRSP